MNTYLTIITTVSRQNKLIKAQLDEIGDITDDDLNRKLEIDKMLITLLPMILDRYEDGNDDEQ